MDESRRKYNATDGGKTIAYANEHLTWQLVAGGGLILIANLLLIARPDQPAHGAPPAVT